MVVCGQLRFPSCDDGIRTPTGAMAHVRQGWEPWGKRLPEATRASDVRTHRQNDQDVSRSMSFVDPGKTGLVRLFGTASFGGGVSFDAAKHQK